MAGGVADHLPTARGVTDEDDVVQIEGVNQCGEICGVGVHVVAVPSLGGASVTAPVVGDGAEAVVGHELELDVPCVGVQGPAMAEDDRLATSPVLVERSSAVGGGVEGHSGVPPLPTVAVRAPSALLRSSLTVLTRVG
jgi:hypothetical protein